MTKNTLLKKLGVPLAAIALVAGGGAIMAQAQTSKAATDTSATATVSSATTGTSADPVDANGSSEANEATEVHTGNKGDHGGPHVDGVVTAVNGTTITVNDDDDATAVVYTVDASKATINAPVKVGDKVMIKGTVTGTNVAATDVKTGATLRYPGAAN